MITGLEFSRWRGEYSNFLSTITLEPKITFYESKEFKIKNSHHVIIYAFLSHRLATDIEHNFADVLKKVFFETLPFFWKLISCFLRILKISFWICVSYIQSTYSPSCLSIYRPIHLAIIAMSFQSILPWETCIWYFEKLEWIKKCHL